jgi:DNA-binding MarR family transcriptional regulator
MTDINLKTAVGSSWPNLLAMARVVGHDVGGPDRDVAIVELIELLFFAYRDFVSDPDKILKDYGFGRAHHRVIHFVGRHPGICVAELLDILRITKQSLGRVLRQLIDTGHVRQESGDADRRQRLLYLTASGQELHDRLMAPQVARVRAAIAAPALKVAWPAATCCFAWWMPGIEVTCSPCWTVRWRARLAKGCQWA